MCWITNKLDGLIGMVAERDIPVRKVVVRTSEGSYRSLYFRAQYGRNVMYEMNGTLEVIDCTIPEGSSYYVNERNEYVSDSIIIVGKSVLYYSTKEGTCAW